MMVSGQLLAPITLPKGNIPQCPLNEKLCGLGEGEKYFVPDGIRAPDRTNRTAASRYADYVTSTP
jgi:hypothetical protein